jgi:hypothetical protein
MATIRDQTTQTLLTSSRLILHADRRTGIGALWRYQVVRDAN